MRSLVFYYLCAGVSFEIEKIEFQTERSGVETATDFFQPFQKSLKPFQIMLPQEIEHIFRDDNTLFTAASHYILAIERQDFDHYWKAFNALFRQNSAAEHDFDQLRDMRSFIEQHHEKFVNTLNLLQSITAEDVRKLRIREYILDTFPDISCTNHFAETVKRFHDVRLAEVFDESLTYRAAFLNTKGLYGDVANHIAQCKVQNIRDNTELLCFYVLKYSYFIRNKYFHAEKSAPLFISKNTMELDELESIGHIFECFLADLIRCSSCYL